MCRPVVSFWSSCDYHNLTEISFVPRCSSSSFASLSMSAFMLFSTITSDRPSQRLSTSLDGSRSPILALYTLAILWSVGYIHWQSLHTPPSSISSISPSNGTTQASVFTYADHRLQNNLSLYTSKANDRH